jgi:hypothetical protein
MRRDPFTESPGRIELKLEEITNDERRGKYSE